MLFLYIIKLLFIFFSLMFEPENDVFGLQDFEFEQYSGIKQLWNLVDPVWKFNEEELVNFMSKRIIYETDEVIVFDKPYQLSYSSGPENQAQMDRILQLLKKQVAPDIERLYLVHSLDKPCSGIIIFAKNLKKQEELKLLLNQGHFYFRFRCLCKNFPDDLPDKTRISIPLIKVIKDGNMKFCPLLGRARNHHQIYHLNTDCKLIDFNKNARVCLIDAFTRSR
ncbi:PseudoU_synth_2 domain-containing protein [Meloidogyne graminicola]|uniref:Pseudouridylate synthase RPUSD4, mitochondrial n=1 Tax=Meloidogyne graminicola TaxID=189291 RepID=A0A8T0A1U9_9BILA|nr:PseudoU_synth_2 domain-containing protein [Meloidogyne graminicola]